jgi:hypothetical protein
MNKKFPMRRFRKWLLRFGGLFNKQRKDRELDEEIESHLREAQQKFIQWCPCDTSEERR